MKQCHIAHLHVDHLFESVDWPYYRILFGNTWYGVPQSLNLTTLSLRAPAVGTPECLMLVDGALLSELNTLRVKCQTACLRIATSAKLTSLSIDNDKSLSLQFEDQQALCAQLEQFSCFGTLHKCKGAPVLVAKGTIRAFPRCPMVHSHF